MPVNFYTEDIVFVLKFKAKRRIWLNTIATQHNITTGNLSYIFTSDNYLLSINKKYINHNYYTDIITFPGQSKDKLSGDIFISIDRVLENARTHNCPFETELSRVMAHGLLHLLGFNDKTKPEQEQMKKGENEAIKLYQSL